MDPKSYDGLPVEIKAILDSYDDDKDQYLECRRISDKLDSMGWSCDYYLDAVIFDVKKQETK